ncbi:unnamed protein product [Trichogramma brassicae]|uniref:28S ribosomal protein S34, mitochondrial n=1 Tax=Trichogramma brassicae TaxID=86971 RepID=A0A6H5IFZ0_9HYME|nr:unnamed protein product [Trichogramma brassicae]
MPFKYIGKTTDFKGKSLWEILGNLKNFGEGRLILRNRFQRYPEPCYYKVLKVEALPNYKVSSYDKRKCITLVQNTFRGNTDPNPIQKESSTYKSDYALVPKHEEHKYLNSKLVHEKRKELPFSIPLPPLLRETYKTKDNDDHSNLEMTVFYNRTVRRVFHDIKRIEGYAYRVKEIQKKNSARN